MPVTHVNESTLIGENTYFEGVVPMYSLLTWVNVARCVSCGLFVTFEDALPAIGWCVHTQAPGGIYACVEIHYFETPQLAAEAGFQ